MTQARPGGRRARTAVLTGALALVAVSPAAATGGPAAELVSGNLFMGTTKVEAGARPNGAFGSAVPAPAGYHPRTQAGAILGFRANPGECDWSAAGCVTRGDFFTPGAPYESWGLQVGDAAGAQAFDDNQATALPGAFISADAGAVTGVWQSAAPFHGISVRQTYSVPSYAWAIDTLVDLTNTTNAPIADVYVMRGVDPDNCRMETTAVCDSDGDGVADAIGTTGGGSGVYETRNTIVSQGSDSTPALVTATQTDGSYLGLRAEGAGARVFVKDTSFSNPASLSALWSGAAAGWRSSPGAGFGDSGIYAVVHVPSIAAGATATVRIRYVVKDVPAAADFAATVPPAGGLIDIATHNGGAAAGGVCAAPAHGTAVVEGGGIRYVPAPGFSGADGVSYSIGGICGTVSVTVPASAAVPAPITAFVVLTAPARRTRLASGALRISQRLRIDHPGRYTFIYTDPATGRRVRQLPGSRVGARRLGRRVSAPVLVTTQPGAAVTLVSVFSRRIPASTRTRLVLRVVLRNPDGMLTDVTPRASPPPGPG